MKKDIEQDARSNRVRSSAEVYGLTLAASVVAGLLRWLCDPFLGDHLPFVTFFVSVAAAAWLGGLRPALLATGLGFVVAWYFFVPPRHSFTLPSGPHLFGLGMYLIVCLTLAAFGEAMHVARRHTEQEQLKTLAERERFRLAAEAVNGIIYEYDFQTGHVERQRGLYEVLGYRVDEVPPTVAWWREQIHPDDHEAIQKRLIEFAGNSITSEYRVRHKDGRWLHLEDRAVLLRGDDGQRRKMIGCTVDVTARKQDEEQLRYSEQLHRVAFDQSPTGMAYVGTDGRFIKVNPTMCEITGYPAEELVGMTVSDLTHPDDRAHDAEILAPFLRGDTPTYENDKRYVQKDGGVRWVSITARMVTDAEGRPLHTVGVALDITARKRVEEALADRTELLNGVLEGTTDVIFVKDLNGRLLLANAACAAVASSIPEQLVGKTGEELHPPDVAAAIRQLDKAVIAGGSPIQIEESIPVAGEPRVFLTLKAPLRDGGGHVVGVLGISRDITESKRAEERLRRSEARFRAAINAVSDIVWTNDAQGQMAGEQAAWGKFTGQDQESYQGYGWSRAIHPDDTQPTIDAWNEAVAEKQPFAFEHRVRRSDGQWRLCSIRAVPVVHDRGEITEWVGVHTDITEQRELQQAMRETDRRKDEFLATLAHELRNPLAPIRNSLQIMKLAGGNPAVVEKSLAIMERQVSQMTHLIDDLMDLSRISGGKIVLQKARLSLADVVQDAVDISRPLIAERGHALVVDLPPEPLYLDADRTRLAQVFGNLLNNAAKYTETGGRIRVAVERHNGDVVVAVEDNGVGISAHMLTRVFDMFAQVDRSLEKSQGGLGIGLNIVKRLAEMHDGSIVAESGGHGAGSRFVVRLPVMLTVTADGPDDDNIVTKDKPARRRILVVDDNRDGATSLAEMMDIMGNDTQTAFDGLEAVAVAETFRPDVILMDIGMPKLNGYEACRRIREQPWGRNVVLVAQTGWGQEDDRRKSEEAGFDFHIVKPVDPAALETMLVEFKATTG